ncbi:hypothetical protein GCM10022295_73010 [Streptomyces osmaniensis]|uniref:Uncharacterized protein n=1 Tax=Streptomyces osmaniensis TaxID=593134 RepID=A0ABP6YCP8_9ACTN
MHAGEAGRAQHPGGVLDERSAAVREQGLGSSAEASSAAGREEQTGDRRGLFLSHASCIPDTRASARTPND